MKSFHFDLGNSSEGPVGMCAQVQAETKEEALAILVAALPEEVCVPTGEPRIEYVNVYIGSVNITVDDIDDAETKDEDAGEAGAEA